MKKIILTTALAAGMIISSTSATIAAPTVKHKPVYSSKYNHKIKLETGYTTAGSYINHINNARFALTAEDIRAAKREIAMANEKLEQLENEDGSYKVSYLKSGRTVYNYASSDNYYYFPIDINDDLKTKDYLEPSKDTYRGYYEGVGTNELETAYLTINPNATDSQNLLFVADRYINSGDYVEADAALAELVNATVLTEKVATMPQEQAKLHLTMAKYHFNSDNETAALNRLDHAQLAIENMINGRKYGYRTPMLVQMRDEIAELRHKLDERYYYNSTVENKLNKWIGQLNEWSRV